jgi:DMSO/TMAO reductase YedYZ molybdopterin-dependent catalytic subunit
MTGNQEQRLSDVVPGRAGTAGAITRQEIPVNIEYPFEALDAFFTPINQFYVRSHYPFPSLDPEAWRLRVEGHVERSFELTIKELTSLPTEDRSATLECAGNGRVFLVPQVDGAQWQLGAVSNARWTGVPLPAILRRAGGRPGAVEVMFEGADRGHAREKPTPPDEIHYAHSIPMRKYGCAAGLSHERPDSARRSWISAPCGHWRLVWNGFGEMGAANRRAG